MGSKGGLGALAGAGVGFMIGGPIGAVALGGAGLQAGAGLDASEQAVEFAKRNRHISAKQAKEILRQASINQKALSIDAGKMQGEQVSAFAAGGVDVSSGTALLVMEETAAAYKREIYEVGRAALFGAQNIKSQAQANVDAAKAGKRAALIGGIANMVSTGATVGMLSGAGGGGGAPAPSPGDATVPNAGIGSRARTISPDPGGF